MNTDCLLICAGKSSRMGTPKEKLLYNNKPFVINIIEKTMAVCKNLYIVVNVNNRTEIVNMVNSFIDESISERIIFAVNSEEDSPMLSSIQVGLKAIDKKTEWILLHQVDQPFLSEQFYSEFINSSDESNSWVQPLYKGKKGHPIMIHKSIFEIIQTLGRDNSLKDISSDPGIKKKYIEFDFPDILNDIDTPEDYRNRITTELKGD